MSAIVIVLLGIGIWYAFNQRQQAETVLERNRAFEQMCRLQGITQDRDSVLWAVQERNPYVPISEYFDANEWQTIVSTYRGQYVDNALIEEVIKLIKDRKAEG